MKALASRLLPAALLAALATWTALDLALRAPPGGQAGGGALVALAVLAGVQGARTSLAPWHRASVGLLGVAYVGERLLWAGVDVGGMLAFLVLLMALASLASLARTFGPVYGSLPADSALAARVDAAALGAYVRALGLVGFTFVASLLLGLLVPLAVVRMNSLAAALGFAIALLLLVALLAAAPSARAGKG